MLSMSLQKKAEAMDRHLPIRSVFTEQVLLTSRVADLLQQKQRRHIRIIFPVPICSLAEKNKKVVAITAAMPDGTGLNRFLKKFPERFFDVGIAEEHAVTFAAGMALGGMIPVFAVYSSFLQRGIDQILHDVCMQDLHVIFAIDRAGFVGADGETHHGCFDLSYLSMIPNMTVMAPKNGKELEEMLKFAVEELDGPCAIRYPKGSACTDMEECHEPLKKGRSEVITPGSEIAVLGVGAWFLSVRRSVRDKRSQNSRSYVCQCPFCKASGYRAS